MIPVPELIVKFLAVPSAELIVLPNEMLAFDVVKVFDALNVVAPVYVCVPEVVTLPPRSEVPEIVRDDVPAVLVIVPFKSKLENC